MEHYPGIMAEPSFKKEEKPEKEYVKKDYSSTTPEEKLKYKEVQDEQVFKQALSNLQNAIKNSVASLKDFRPDLNMYALTASEKASHVNVVQKEFKDESIMTLTTPTLETRGFSGLIDGINDLSHYLQGGVKIDVSRVMEDNIEEAIFNVQYFQNKLTELEKRVRFLGSTIDATLVKMAGGPEREKFGVDQLKEAKKLVTPIIQQIKGIETDLNGALVMINDKRPTA
jgi:hypothetical protein